MPYYGICALRFETGLVVMQYVPVMLFNLMDVSCPFSPAYLVAGILGC